MPFRIHLFLLIVLLLQLNVVLSPHYVYSQKLVAPINAYNHTLTTEDGLTQNNVACIIKDRDGFMWMGTGEGLNRFDGYSFIYYNHSDNDSSSISNNAVRNMLLDSKGRLWVGTYDGLNLYDSEKETFRKFLMKPAKANAASHNTILYLLEDSHHQLWIGSYGEIYKIDLETFNIKKYDHKNDSTGLDGISALLEDRNGKIWASTAKGISIIGPTDVERIYHSEARGGLPADKIITMVQDATGALYFGTNGSGVLRLSNENDRTFEYYTTTPGKPFFDSDIIGALCLDKDGKLLVGTDGAGIFKQDDAGNFRKILGSQSRHLHNGNVGNIFVDEHNTYWLSLFGGGVQVVYASGRHFEHYRYFDLNMERIGKNSVLAIAEDQHQKIWIGTDGAGLYKFDPESKLFTSYQHSSTNKNSLSANVIKSLLVDEKNNVYAGTYGGGLNYLNTKTESFSRYMHVPGDGTSISTNHVWSLFQDSNHRIYAGQLAALDEFLPTKKVFKPLLITGPRYTPAIYSMIEDKTGNVWIGMPLDGLHRYEPKTGKFKSFLNIPGDSTSMPTNAILELGVNFEGKLLVGSADKGLILFDPEKFNTKQIATLDFKEKNITNILEDDSHNIWFTSFDGVHKFDPATSLVYDYTIADGLQGTQFNEGARLKSSDGTYYLGGTNGLNVFRPEKIIDDTAKAKVVFTQLNLFNIPVKINDKSGLLTKSISQTKSITLQADQNVFSLEFACLEFKFPKKNEYRYFLDGFDKVWNENTSRSTTYTNLPPGEYTLKISASNGSGHWNENAASIKIIVIPHWYERLETRSGAAILLIILTVFIIHFRTKLLFKQKVKLEQLVKARTNLIETQKVEIKDKNKRLEQAYEEVNSTNEELQRVNLNLEKLVENRTTELTLTIKKLIETDKGLDTFLYRSSHDLRGPIATILGLAHLGKKQSTQELNLYFTNIEKTSTRMLRLLKRLDETSSLFRTERTLEVINVNNLIQNIKTSIEELNTNNIVRIEFENKIINQVFTGDAALLKCIIANLMENSIVFRSNEHPYVKCVLSIEQGQLIVNVIDNGTGIPSSVLDRISNMFYRGSEKSIGNGLGLFMVKKALEILEGTMEINSEPGVMTTITVRVPCA